MSNTFQWTPELWCEFLNGLPVMPPSFAANAEQFKASKEPKKEWEIVDFQVHKDSKLLYTLREDGRYRADAHQQRDGFSLDSMLRESEIIHSVRRLSDGEVFSVGDRIKSPGFPNGAVIETFKVESEKLFLSLDKGCGLMEVKPGHLEQVVKLPAPLFTTMDGVEINPENPNRIYPVDKDFGYMVTTLTEYNKDAWGNHKVFSTREAAETYILNHRLLLSLNDVKKAFAPYEYLAMKEVEDKLTSLVKSKLNL